jgi:hypothetical protein
MDFYQAGASGSELLIASGQEAEFHTPSRRNGTEACFSFLAPGERPGRVKFLLHTSTSGFSALAMKFIDSAWNKRLSGQKDREKA